MRRRLFLIALTFVVGAAAGVGAAFIAWKPYGTGSLTRAVLRKCGTRSLPKGDARCTQLVSDALDTWFLDFYAGDPDAPRPIR